MTTDDDPRLNALKSRLESLRPASRTDETPNGESAMNDRENMSTGLRAGAELVTSIAAGGLIGYWLDKAFDTGPIFLIALLILGVITGFVNVWRTTQNIGYKVGYADQLKTERTKDKAERNRGGPDSPV